MKAPCDNWLKEVLQISDLLDKLGPTFKGAAALFRLCVSLQETSPAWTPLWGEPAPPFTVKLTSI